jgi:hypothetical protein
VAQGFSAPAAKMADFRFRKFDFVNVKRLFKKESPLQGQIVSFLPSYGNLESCVLFGRL